MNQKAQNKQIHTLEIFVYIKLIRDLLKIYALFVQFILTFVASFLLDIGMFQVFIMLWKAKYASYIMMSTMVARGISSVYNFPQTKKQVFRSKEKIILVR